MAHQEDATELRSAGGVVRRAGESGTEVLLIHRRSPSEWRLPKGKLEHGETPQQAAVREVREETGIQGEVQQFLGGTRYRYQERADGPSFDKRVAFYLMRPLGGRLHAEKGMDAAGFAPLPAAMRLLTFEDERKIVRRAIEVLGGLSNY